MYKASYSYRANGNFLYLVRSMGMGHGFLGLVGIDSSGGGHGEAIPLPCLLKGQGGVAEGLFV